MIIWKIGFFGISLQMNITELYSFNGMKYNKFQQRWCFENYRNIQENIYLAHNFNRITAYKNIIISFAFNISYFKSLQNFSILRHLFQFTNYVQLWTQLWSEIQLLLSSKLSKICNSSSMKQMKYPISYINW